MYLEYITGLHGEIFIKKGTIQNRNKIHEKYIFSSAKITLVTVIHKYIFSYYFLNFPFEIVPFLFHICNYILFTQKKHNFPCFQIDSSRFFILCIITYTQIGTYRYSFRRFWYSYTHIFVCDSLFLVFLFLFFPFPTSSISLF